MTLRSLFVSYIILPDVEETLDFAPLDIHKREQQYA